jgi:hypothetical protein
MANAPWQTVAKHFYYRKAILEYYDSSFNLIERREFDVLPDNRFLFHGMDLDTLYVSFDNRYEIIIHEEFILKESEGKFIYVPKNTGIPVSQIQIDKEITSKILSLSNNLIPNFLTYQLRKYPRKKEVLKNWRVEFEKESNFFDTTNNWLYSDKQKIALDWINIRIRKSDRRKLTPPKDIPLETMFKSKDLLDSTISKLEEKGFIKYSQFTGRYEWSKKGQDLAVLGEVLQKGEYFKDWIEYQDRRNSLVRFFSVAGMKGYSYRTFQKSTIEEVYNLKRSQFRFLRPN